MIDTNVLISALLCEGTSRDCLKMIVTSEHTVLTTLKLQDELNQVIRRKALTETAERLSIHTQLQEREQIVTPDPNFSPICRDPDDDRVLACAVSANADLILSGDNDLLTLHPFKAIRILTPRQFLNQFGTNPIP